MAEEFEEEDLTLEEEEQLRDLMRSYASPLSEEKQSKHAFLNQVAKSKDTLKTGNLSETELGAIILPVRSLKSFELLFEDLCGDNIAAGHCKKEAETITASSLSKNGFLVSKATEEKRVFSETAREKKNMTANRGWFVKKNKEGES